MKTDHITAKWARETSQNVLSTKVEEQLRVCFIGIEAAVSRNDMYCHVGIYPHDLTIKELNTRGFTTKYHDAIDQRDGGYLEIKW